jgi:hypothetical protein
MVTADFCLGEQGQGLIALCFGIGFIALRYPHLQPKWQQVTQLQCHLSPYYFTLAIAVLRQTLTTIFLST